MFRCVYGGLKANEMNKPEIANLFGGEAKFYVAILFGISPNVVWDSSDRKHILDIEVNGERL